MREERCATPLRAMVPAKEAAAAVALLESTTLREYLDARHSEPHARGMEPKKEARSLSRAHARICVR